jgi:hypothetical protein
MNPEIHGPIGKGKSRKQLKAKAGRAEAKVKKAVRLVCMLRDGDCRICMWENNPEDWQADDLQQPADIWEPIEWAHMHSRRRSQTRNQAPEIRHDSAHSLMLCRFHHTEYDAHRLIVTALTRKGADGPLKFRMAK